MTTVDTDLCFTEATALAHLIRERRLSPVEVMQNTLARIEQINPLLNCFCFVYFEESLERAKRAEQDVMAGKSLGALHGVPIAFKDMTPTRGKRTTRGSRMYERWVPDRDAAIVSRLIGDGAIMVGKTTTPEFAYDGFTQSPLWGVTRNPWDPARTSGGSSGGAAAAVASGCVSMAEGTDMGGSVRIPAAYCGVIGLKPSLGRIPMDILPTVFDNISHFGPLTHTIGDANLFMNVAAGPDERDIMSLPDKLQFPVPAEDDVEDLRIALIPDLGYYEVDSEVERHVRAAGDALACRGATVEEAGLPWSREINDAWYSNWGVYLAVCFARDIDEWRDRLDPNVVALVDSAQHMSAIEFRESEIVRTRQWHQLCDLFERYDALICPTMSATAPPVGSTDSDFAATTADGRYRGLDMTAPFNFVSQCPALSVPCGFDERNLPIGLQIVGHRFSDLTVMRVGAAVEAAQPRPRRRPPDINSWKLPCPDERT